MPRIRGNDSRSSIDDSAKAAVREPTKPTKLIQRLLNGSEGSIRNPFSFGGGYAQGGLTEAALELFDGIIDFDYMGRGEFEFGAVPNAFRTIALYSSENNAITGALELEGRPVYYLCSSGQEAHVRETLKKLAKDEAHMDLAAPSGLKKSLTEEHSTWTPVGWLELDNGFMFFTDREMFVNVSKLFGLDAK